MNPALATPLTPGMGYLRAARLAGESREKERSIRDPAIGKGILAEEEAATLFDLEEISKNRLRKG